MKPARIWKGLAPKPRTQAQMMAYKENYQLFQLKGMIGHLHGLIYVDHRNAVAYLELIKKIQDLQKLVLHRQSCRINPNQSKCLIEE